ncbi:23S rRNA pseudouridine1911/1915/1917 synthase [Mobilisporobacter senegalensis]|uniref:RNA pseudouridylate synthase n=1 Tax=Mobilisporobacter senegalensis TaxID=1329262 RepID=A0A3N1XA78_9FIRM|nr:RluA family pseudouridine synthase [Mobilisporobacter senegalensis]ROR23643.1 23S rRNA pseudouridine1911/1915/1917 synthase [Mobilisporobacter senegalensis]
MNINILYEDNEIIVCEKPPGMPAQSDKSSDFDMVNYLKNYIFEKGGNPPYIGLIHRLDRPVGGIMVFAKTPHMAKTLSEQIRLKKITKKYLAVSTSDMSNELDNKKRLLTDYIAKDGRTNLSKITSQTDKNGKKAELYYKVLDVIKEEIDEDTKLSLIEIELLTGRHHQIRLQMSAHGNPLWGDTKYNPAFSDVLNNTRKWTDIALFAYQLEFSHPKSKEKMKFEIRPKAKPFINFKILETHA